MGFFQAGDAVIVVGDKVLRPSTVTIHGSVGSVVTESGG